MPRWRELWRQYDVSGRVLALVLAVAVWFVATGDSQEAPTVTHRVQPRLEVHGVARDLQIVEAPSVIDVRLEGVGRLTPPAAGEVTATLDLTGVGSGTYQLQPTVTHPPGYNVTESPVVQITLDRTVTVTWPVQVAVTGVRPGVVVEPLPLETGEVQVSGAESRVTRIAEVLAPLDVGGVAVEDEVRTYQRSVFLRALDRDGRVVANVRLEPLTIRAGVLLRPVDTPGPDESAEPLGDDQAPAGNDQVPEDDDQDSVNADDGAGGNDGNTADE